LLNSGVKAVISGHFGPKAFQVLRGAGIEAYSAINMTVKEALAQFQEGKLTKLTGADVSSHW
jgi:predicted Fe-Mo cluster-binding NifX family protein